jgi:hypothetical protein
MLKFEKIETNKMYHAEWIHKNKKIISDAFIIDKDNNFVQILFITSQYWESLDQTNCNNSFNIISKEEWEKERMGYSYASTYFASKTIEPNPHIIIPALFTID